MCMPPCLVVTQYRSVGEVVGGHWHHPLTGTVDWGGEDCPVRMMQRYRHVVQYMFNHKRIFFK